MVAGCERHGNVIAPFVSAPGKRHESPRRKEALPQVTWSAKPVGLDLHHTLVSLEGVYASRANRKASCNRDRVPKMPEKPRGRKTPKRGRKPLLAPAMFQERFRTSERVCVWAAKFRRLLRRFERLSQWP